MRCLPIALGIITMSVALTAHADDIRVGGSTTSLPIISSCAAHFMEKYPSWDKADPSLAKSPTVIYVTGGGSGFGVKGILNGTIDVGMVARELKESEIKEIGDPVMKPFALDAVAIASSAKSPLAKVRQNFTTAELAPIFSGQIALLSQIDKRLPPKPIILITRDAAGGITEIFQQKVMKEERLSASRLQFPSTAGMIKKLESSDSALAFISAGSISKDAQVKTYSVDGVQPTQENIVSGKYSLSRPLLIISKQNPSRQTKLFMDYVLDDCQSTVGEMGFVPVKKRK